MHILRGNREMKVVWFSNTPANGAQAMGGKSAGSGTWLQQLNIDIEKHVVFL